MRQVYDLSQLSWKLAGFQPYHWVIPTITDITLATSAETPAIAAAVPGSVQGALHAAGLLPDWNIALNYRQYEWVENRHWIYQVELPGELRPSDDQKVRLVCQGLDDRGWIYLNGQEVGRFATTHLPYTFDLSAAWRPDHNRLWIIFDTPPRWLGQIGYTSQMTDWKPRFYYSWDWITRLVQIGIWDAISLEISDGAELGTLRAVAQYNLTAHTGTLRLWGQAQGSANCSIQVRLFDGKIPLRTANLPLSEFNASSLLWTGLPVKSWMPNGSGSQPLYQLSISLFDSRGILQDELIQTVGFKSVEWRACAGAPPEADPWLCVINGRPLFLQGINWTPIRPNFADLTPSDYKLRLEQYRKLGVNLLRVWGGGFIETETFYNLCDELGLLVWQEFPLSSSGVDNWPPEDTASISALAAIAESAVARRQHHASLLCWCGGNELQGDLDGSKTGGGKPVSLSHPLIQRLAEVTTRLDPGRRFLPTSSSGPRFSAERASFGKGLHWDVHGPWKAPLDLNEWQSYWQEVDALFHSEVGAPGASSAELILFSAGDLPVLPGTADNPLWRRTSWWIEWAEFIATHDREPNNLEEYVTWSQERQAQALSIVAHELKAKFPRCGGVIFWMGHDSFPCTANTSILDYAGEPKPAALALAKIFLNPR